MYINIFRAEREILARNLDFQRSNERKFISEVVDIRRGLGSTLSSCIKPDDLEHLFEEKLKRIQISLENEFKIQISNLDNQLSKLRAELHAREINESFRKGIRNLFKAA